MGYWDFTYTLISTWTDTYKLYDIFESEGEYYIRGYDVDLGAPAVASYFEDDGNYALLARYSSFDQFFVFNFTGTNTVAGTYYMVIDDYFSNGYPFTGIKTREINSSTTTTTVQPKTTTTTTIKLTSSSTSSTTTSTSITPTTTTTILVPVPTSTSSISSTTTTIISICLIEQIYGENSEEVQKLRFIRDNVLNQTPEGQEIIRLYYEWSPVIVEMMNENEGFKQGVKEMIDGVVEVIREVEWISNM
jgi:hypothetical protein